MTDAKFFLDAVKFLIQNFSELRRYFVIPAISTLSLFIILVLAATRATTWLHTMLTLKPGFFSQALAVAMHMLGIISVIIILQLLFVPLWQLIVMPLMEGLLIKSCVIYAKKIGITIQQKEQDLFKDFLFSIRISLAVFIRQVIFRIVLALSFFFMPLLGILAPFVDFISNYLFAHYDYFNILLLNFSERPRDFNHLRIILARMKIPSISFRINSALIISLPIISLLGVFVNAISIAMLFCQMKKNSVLSVSKAGLPHARKL